LAALQKQAFGGQLQAQHDSLQSNNKAFADDLGDLEEEARILLEN
jgi:hypothetical protein